MMSLNGVGVGLGSEGMRALEGGAGWGAPAGGRTDAARGDGAPTAANGSEGARRGAMPAGVDAALWGVLNTEERGWFSRLAALGPLLYSRPHAAISLEQTALVLGGRIDVRA